MNAGRSLRAVAAGKYREIPRLSREISGNNRENSTAGRVFYFPGNNLHLPPGSV